MPREMCTYAHAYMDTFMMPASVPPVKIHAFEPMAAFIKPEVNALRSEALKLKSSAPPPPTP